MPCLFFWGVFFEGTFNEGTASSLPDLVGQRGAQKNLKRAAMNLLKLAHTHTAAQALLDFTGVPKRVQGKLEEIYRVGTSLVRVCGTISRGIQGEKDHVGVPVIVSVDTHTHNF
jgi:hypothetical protein